MWVLRIVLFVAVLLGCVLFAWARGGAPERAVASCFAVGFVATLASYSALPARFAHVEAGVAMIDAAMLGVLMLVAARADRGWPLAVAALQVDIVAVHALKTMDTGILRPVYAVMMTVWAYPQLALLAIGVVRHQQRVARHGADKSWSDSRWDPAPIDRAK